MRRGIVTLWMVSATIVTPAAQSQDSREVSSRLACQQCRIDVSGAVPFAYPWADSAPMAYPRVAARDSRGRVYAVFRSRPSDIVVYDTNGRVLTTINGRSDTIAKRSSIRAIQVLFGDTLLVFDWAAERVTVLSTRGIPVAVRALPGKFYDAVSLSGGAIVINANVKTADAVGLPLHTLGEDGNIARSFGTDTAVYRPDLEHLLLRLVAPAGKGSVWAGHRTKYQLDLWNAEGRRLRSIVRKASWFPPSLLQEEVTPTSPPRPYVSDVRQDGEGRLWTIVRVPRRSWRRGLARIESEGRTMYRISDPALVYDSVIEVIDPVKGELVASRRVSGAIGEFLDSSHVLSYVVDPSGGAQAVVSRISLNSTNHPRSSR